jgi:hypothetical protein
MTKYDRWKLASPWEDDDDIEDDEEELTDEELDDAIGDAKYHAMRDDELTED